MTVDTVAYIIIIGNTVVLTALWLLFGRDKRPVVTLEVRPPENLDPLEMEYILHGNTTDKGIFSMIVFWSSKGIVELKENLRGHIAKCIGNLPVDAPGHEALLFQMLFEHQDFVMFENMPLEAEDGWESIQDELEKEIGEITTDASVIASFLGTVLFALTTSIIAFLYMPIVLWIVNVFLALCIGFSLFLGVLFCQFGGVLGAKAAYYKPDIVLGVILILLALSGSLLIFYLFHKDIIMAGVFLICFAASVVLTVFMERRNNNALFGRVLGFRNYIETVEINKLKKLSEEDPHYGHDILPYAMLFNMGTNWSATFENIIITNIPSDYMDDYHYVEDLEKAIEEKKSRG